MALILHPALFPDLHQENERVGLLERVLKDAGYSLEISLGGRSVPMSLLNVKLMHFQGCGILKQR